MTRPVPAIFALRLDTSPAASDSHRLMLHGATLPDRLQQAAATQPDGVAVGVHAGDTVTFAAWERRSDALAGGLRRAGIGGGDRVAVLFDAARWADFAVACLGVHKATAVAVPLGTSLTELEQRRVLGHAEPAALVAPAGLGPTDVGVPTHPPERLEADGAAQPLNAPARPDDLAEVCYRSRPLSRPVPVPRAHRSLLAGPWASLALGGSARSLVHPFQLGTPEGQNALWTSLSADPLTVTAIEAFDPERVCSALGATAPSACALHPVAAEALLDAGATTPRGLSRLDTLILSSGRVTADLLVRLTAALPDTGLHLIDVLSEPGTARDAFTHDRRHPGALGRPRGSTTVWVGDRAGRPASHGQVARLWLTRSDRGVAEPTDAVGYTDAAGRVHLVSGEVETVRRRGGPTLSRTEIAGVLRTRPDVADAVVLGTPRDREADELVAAVVARDPAAPPEPDELQAFVAGRLGPDERPDTVALIDDVPRNQAGIALWDRLRQRLGLPPAGDDAASDPATAPPPEAVNDVESTLVHLWQRVLGVEGVGREQNFFELDGGWVDVAKLLDLVAATIGVRVPLAAFLAAPTVTGLATAIQQHHPHHDPAGPAPGPEPAEPSDAHGPRQAPIASSQQGMLWHERFAPGCQNLPGLARRFRGPLDLDALERALDEIVRRHGALRTTFEVRNGEPVQTVHPHQPVPLPVQDLSHLPASERDTRVRHIVADAGTRPLDLVAGPLFAASVVRLDDDDHVLIIRTHHSVFDDWSVSVFRHELATLYTAYAERQASPLPDPPVQFADFSRDERDRLAGSHGARELTFWRRELAGAPLATQLPVDDPHRPQGSAQPAGEPVTVTLPAEVRTGLQRVARTQRATLFMTMLTAFGVLVHRYTRQDDLVLATVVAHRNRTELEGLIGCFTKKVPLRLQLGDDPTFSEALARTRKALLGALSHQDLAFEDVVQDVLGPAAATHGLVPHLSLMFQGVTPQHDLDVPGVDSIGFDTSSTTTRPHFMAGDDEPDDNGHDRGSPGGHERGEAAPPPWGDGLYLGTFLILSVHDSGDQLSCLARGAYHAPAVRDLLARLHTLLADVAADPDRPVSGLALLDAEARDEAMARGQGPSATPSPDRTLLAALRHQVAQHPDAVAISTSTQTVTYAELDTHSTRLAWRLRAAGAGRDTRVGVALQPSPELLVAVLAAWKAGAAWLALDPNDSETSLTSIVSQAAPTAIVSANEHERFAHYACVVSPEPIIDSPQPDAAPEPDDPAAPDGVGPGDEAIVFHTGGASQQARGVVLDHETVTGLAARLNDALDDESADAASRVALCGPATHDGFVWQLVRLIGGQRLHIPDGLRESDPHPIVSLLGDGTVDVVDCTPAELEALQRAGLAEALRHRRPARVDPLLVVSARGPVGPDRWRSFGELPRARTVVLYGPPECALAATARAPVRAEERADTGRPLPGATAHVLDAHGHPVPDRALGELHIGGRGLAQHPTGQSARRLPDGRVELLGPAATDADLRGFHVDPPRVARALLDVPGVSHATVKVERDDHDAARLVAEVVADGPPPTLEQARVHLWARLPGYAWPTQLVCRSHQATPASQSTGHPPTSHGPPSPPLTAQARVLTAAWAHALSVDHVVHTDNYWQAFSFLEGLARARDIGTVVGGQDVTRHRTVGTLALSLAAAPRLAANQHLGQRKPVDD